jgi:ketosteroid isomerase-like protein
MLDAYVRGDNDTALAYFHPETEFDVTIRPEGKVYRGRAGVAEAMRTWTGTFEDFHYEVEEIIDAGDSVLVVERQRGRGKGSGVLLDQQMYSLFALQDGQILRAKWFMDRDQAFTVAGIAADERPGL